MRVLEVSPHVSYFPQQTIPERLYHFGSQRRDVGFDISSRQYPSYKWPRDNDFARRKQLVDEKEPQSSKLESVENYERAVKKSRRLLELSDNWDDEGSPRVNSAAWNKATDFVLEMVRAFTGRIRRPLPVPAISAGPEGSIDVHWRTERREILLNFSADQTLAPSYYGDNYADETIKGTLDTTSKNIWLLYWLIRG